MSSVRAGARRRANRRSPRQGVKEAAPISFGSDLEISDFRFHNGLRLLLLPDRSAPVVSYQTWVRVGSRHEPDGKTGLAHLLEHLMFKETEKFPVGEFDRLLELEGAEVNAATWTDWTCYYENLPKRSLPVAIELESDRLRNLILRSEPFESERGVVINERKSSVDDDPEARAAETLYATAFQTHPYRWPTIGWMRDIRRVTLGDCQKFYRTYYAPNNVTLVAVGDFDPREVVDCVGAAYGHLARTRIPREQVGPEPTIKRPRRRTLRLATDTSKLLYGWHAPPYGSVDYLVLEVLSEILSGGRSARLRWRLVTEDELAVSVSSDVAPFAMGGLFDVAVDARAGTSIADLSGAIDGELGRLLDEGPTADELETARNRLELATLAGLETAAGKADQIGFDAVVCGRPGATFDFLQAYASISIDQCREVARRYLSPQRRTEVLVLSKGEA